MQHPLWTLLPFRSDSVDGPVRLLPANHHVWGGFPTVAELTLPLPAVIPHQDSLSR